MIKKQKIIEYLECPKCGYTEIIDDWYNTLCPNCKKEE